MKISDAPDGLLYIPNQNSKFVIKHTRENKTYVLLCANTGYPWSGGFEVECFPLRLHEIGNVVMIEKLSNTNNEQEPMYHL